MKEISRKETYFVMTLQAPLRVDPDESLAIRAAWLHYAAGLTQTEVAARLGVTPVKAHRLVAWASRSGAVKVSVDGAVAECLALEAALAAQFGLAHCTVVPDLGETGLPLRALGLAGAAHLRREIAARQGGVIGIGHGRTLAAAVAAMPRAAAGDVRFVSLLGGVTQSYAANPYDVMHRLAAVTGAAAYVMPVPCFANSAEDREVILAQRGLGDVFALAASADPMIVGIGSTDADGQLVASRMIDADEMAGVRAAGGVGEILGHFLDADGGVVETPLSGRTMSVPLAALPPRGVTAIAGGAEKIAAIRAVLRSGRLAGLVTDERSAEALAA